VGFLDHQGLGRTKEGRAQFLLRENRNLNIAKNIKFGKNIGDLKRAGVPLRRSLCRQACDVLVLNPIFLVGQEVAGDQVEEVVFPAPFKPR
jgi:hypothetical protein